MKNDNERILKDEMVHFISSPSLSIIPCVCFHSLSSFLSSGFGRKFSSFQSPSNFRFVSQKIYSFIFFIIIIIFLYLILGFTLKRRYRNHKYCCGRFFPMFFYILIQKSIRSAVSSSFSLIICPSLSSAVVVIVYFFFVHLF